jgi:hypothetical protein
MARTLTAANSVLLLGIVGLFDVPQQLQGFGTEDIFDTDAIEPAETMMGVDGRLSGGFVPKPIVQNITLQADSASNLIFETWYQAQQTVREIYYATGAISLPSLNRKYVMVRGILTSTTVTPTAKKVMQPRKYGITWERVTGAPF